MSRDGEDQPHQQGPHQAAAANLFTNPNSGAVTGNVTAVDLDSDNFTYTGPPTTKKGAVAFDAGGNFTYTPTAAARTAASAPRASTTTKTDSFTVTVDDGHGGKDTVTVKVTIAPVPGVNHAPDAGFYGIDDTDTTTGAIAGTAYASDVDRDVVTFTGSATTTHGAVVVNTDGTFTYTPTVPARENAAAPAATLADKEDHFTVTAGDAYGGTVAIPVTVTVVPNNAPTAALLVGTPHNGIVTGSFHGSTPTAIR